MDWLCGAVRGPKIADIALSVGVGVFSKFYTKKYSILWILKCHIEQCPSNVVVKEHIIDKYILLSPDAKRSLSFSQVIHIWWCLSFGCRQFDLASSGSLSCHTPMPNTQNSPRAFSALSPPPPLLGFTLAFILEAWLHPLLLPLLPSLPPLSPPIRRFICECFIASCPCRGGPLGLLQTSKKI